MSDTIGIYRSALDLTKSRLAAQIASPVDVDRAQTQLSSAEAQASDLALRRTALEDAIAALVGKSAASFAIARSARALPLPSRPRAVPADVLRRRPTSPRPNALPQLQGMALAWRARTSFPRFTLMAIGGAQDTGFRLFNPGNTFGTIGRRSICRYSTRG